MDPATTLALALSLISVVFTIWSFVVNRRYAERLAERQERLLEVTATQSAFSARLLLLGALLDDDSASVNRAFETLAQHIGQELLRYYGSLDLIRRWWAVSDAIADFRLDKSRAKTKEEAIGLARTLSLVRRDVERALRESRAELIEGKFRLMSPEDQAQLATEIEKRSATDRLEAWLSSAVARGAE